MKKVAIPSAFDLFKPSKDAFMRNLWPFLALYLLIPVAGTILGVSALVALNYGEIQTTANNSAFGSFGNVFSLLIGLVVLAFVLYMMVVQYLLVLRATATTKEVSISKTLKDARPVIWKTIATTWLLGLATMLGFLLLIIPGVIILHRYFLAPFVMLDKNCGIKEAFEKSKQLTAGYPFAVWGIIGVTVLISLIGYVPLIGWLISIVLSLLYVCAPAVRYHQLKELKKI